MCSKYKTQVVLGVWWPSRIEDVRLVPVGKICSEDEHDAICCEEKAAEHCREVSVVVFLVNSKI